MLDDCGVCGGPGIITFCYDSDGDMLGAPTNTVLACSVPVGYVEDCTDGDDNCTCEANDETCYDCGGVCDGPAEIDVCGECDGNNSTCGGCTDTDANNYDPDAILDDESCNYCTPGDINFDGVFTVTDVVQLVNFILPGDEWNGGEPPSEDQQCAADVNGDENVNILDIVSLTHLILSNTLFSGHNTHAVTLTYGNGNMSYTADGDIAGVQIEVIGNYNIIGNALPSGWQIYYREGTILLFSLDGSFLTNQELFQYTGDFTISSAIAADWYDSSINVNSTLCAELGDVTGDGEINVLDLVQITSSILDISTTDYPCAADFSGDGEVNILDLVQIVNFILNME